VMRRIPAVRTGCAVYSACRTPVPTGLDK
jgi:hypothetical protein